MRSFLIVLNLILIVGAVLWWISSPGWAPFTTTMAGSIAFLTQLFKNDNIKDHVKMVFRSNVSGDQVIANPNFEIRGEKDSTSLNVGVAVVNQGMGYEDTKSMIMDLIHTNMPDYRDIAKKIANERSEEITDKVLQNILKINKDALEEFKNPGMQDTFYQAQKAYAISGDKDVSDLLVDILTNRAITPQRNHLQIVLDEAIRIAPKLTLVQLDTLTIRFLLKHNIRNDLSTYDEFKDYIVNDVFLFADNLPKTRQDFMFMDFLGCGQIRAGRGPSIETIMQVYYPIFFSRGLSEEELKSETVRLGLLSSLETIPCFHDKGKFQLNVFNNRELQDKLNELGVDRRDIHKYFELVKNSTMNKEEIKAKLYEIGPKMDNLFKSWFKTFSTDFEISSVGFVVAHANYRRKTKKSLDLSNWIK